jgi:hypothetical protein
MTAFEKVRSLYTQLSSGGRVNSRVFEQHLKELYAEHEQLLASIKTKSTSAMRKVESVIEEGLKKTGL